MLFRSRCAGTDAGDAGMASPPRTPPDTFPAAPINSPGAASQSPTGALLRARPKSVTTGRAAPLSATSIGRGGAAIPQPVQGTDCLESAPLPNQPVLESHTVLERIPPPRLQAVNDQEMVASAGRSEAFRWASTWVPGVSGVERGLEAERSTSSSHGDPSGCASQATWSITGGAVTTWLDRKSVV